MIISTPRFVQFQYLFSLFFFQFSLLSVFSLFFTLSLSFYCLYFLFSLLPFSEVFLILTDLHTKMLDFFSFPFSTSYPSFHVFTLSCRLFIFWCNSCRTNLTVSLLHTYTHTKCIPLIAGTLLFLFFEGIQPSSTCLCLQAD